MQNIVEAADKIIAAVDQTALAKHLARKTPEEGPGAKERKKQAEEQKAALIDALEKKASALLEMQPAESDAAMTETPDDSDGQAKLTPLCQSFKAFALFRAGPTGSWGDDWSQHCVSWEKL